MGSFRTASTRLAGSRTNPVRASVAITTRSALVNRRPRIFNIAAHRSKTCPAFQAADRRRHSAGVVHPKVPALS